MFINLLELAVGSIQQRFSSHGYSEDIGPPASFNQLPQPEGDWTDNHNKKQTKYNSALAASAVFFVATIAFVREHLLRIFIHSSNNNSMVLFQVKQSGIIFFNVRLPDTYE